MTYKMQWKNVDCILICSGLISSPSCYVFIIVQNVASSFRGLSFSQLSQTTLISITESHFASIYCERWSWLSSGIIVWCSHNNKRIYLILNADANHSLSRFLPHCWCKKSKIFKWKLKKRIFIQLWSDNHNLETHFIDLFLCAGFRESFPLR